MTAEGSAGEAERLLESAESELFELSVDLQRAEWVHATFVTEDTSALASRAYARLIERTVARILETRRLRSETLSPVAARKLYLLRTSLPLVAPDSREEGEELTRLVNSMQDLYARGRVALPGRGAPVELEAVERLLATSRDAAELEEAWTAWHAVARPMRAPFARYVALANRGARAIGFADLGELWRARYDMPPAAFASEVDRLWEQLRGFYQELHAFVRAALVSRYGAERVDPRGPIPAHLLGNMWAQSWEHLMPLVAPDGSDSGVDLTGALAARGTTPRQMVEYAERFFVSIGLPALPATFWERSMLTRPRDRDVVCHASAWDIDFAEDLRIKMCIDITGEDFRTIHHELGHNYYQRAYGGQPFLFRESANDGFHEAIGDTISLSVTPAYLRQVGLAGSEPDAGGELAALLLQALESVAFLPFGLLVDKWRWQVFDGTIGPEEYTASWWRMRRHYQGVSPPGERGEDDFDPGAKYHVAANVPYMRYFLAGILQYQFHRALARIIGWQEPLHRCSIFGRPEAGRRLGAMLALGASRPWPEALAALTEERAMDARALLDYFSPLRAFLREKLRGVPVGW